MADFKNTIDVLGDDAVFDSIIERTIQEYKDNTITQVGQYAFFRCAALNTVHVPNATKLDTSAFSGCNALVDIVADKVATIGAGVFTDCKALKSVRFPTLKEIPASCFSGCTALQSADFAAVTKISTTVFYGCSLSTLILRNTAGVATLGSTNSFVGTPIESGKGYIYVPSALADSYKAASYWSTFANQFRKLEEWTVDGTVTGELATNRHMVRFFNSDGTLLGYKIVTTGSNATWDGADPVNPNGEDPFNGFNPEPVNVTADMECYATFKNAWDDVLASIAAGTYATEYAIGDTVPLDLGSEGVIDMQIVAFDTDDLADGSGKAPITWIAKTLLATSHRMNPSLVTNADGTYQDGTGSIGGWEKCEMRTYIKETIKPLIPETVRNAIKEVTKSHDAYDTSGKRFTQTTTDDVWFVDWKELSAVFNGIYSAAFPNNASAARGAAWWYRTAANVSEFRNIGLSGDKNSSTKANMELRIGICFCT